MSDTPKYYLNPDYRRTPKSNDPKKYCARCQKDIKPGTDHMLVNIDWDALEVWADNNGQYRIGMNCWRQIKQESKINK